MIFAGYKQIVTGVGHFEVYWVIVLSNCTMGLFWGRYLLFYWLLQLRGELG